MTHMFLNARLIRTEVTTLIGLMMRAPIDFRLPTPEVVSGYIESSDALLGELHQTMVDSYRNKFPLEGVETPEVDPLQSKEALREVIFYSGESAYPSQFRDLAPEKYRADAAWLLQHKGVDLEVGRAVCRRVIEVLNKRLTETLINLSSKPTPEWTILPGFSFSCREIADLTNHPIERVRSFVEAFTLPEGEYNTTFTSLNSFNCAYAYPFVRRGPDKFFLLQYFGMTESFYDTPFYWMCDDESYRSTAFRHRGEFTEDFAAERLTHVFGDTRVFRNVEIIKSRGEIVGEIDALVLFGDRAIVLQAKSKKLTLEARKGNDRLLRKDFKAAVQDSVDQALNCARFLGDSSLTLRNRDGQPILLAERPHTIFPVAVVADHYPGLAFQTRQFLHVHSTETILTPLVLDVFTLDAIAEMLASPLRFLSYLNLRARFAEKFFANHETTLLSYHLRYNLWRAPDVDLVHVGDDVSTPLDIAMAVRREGVPGAATPDGILTMFIDTPLARLLEEIEDQPLPATIDLGLQLLELRGKTIEALNGSLNEVLARTAADGDLHDVTTVLDDTATGLTIHCSRLPDREAEEWLRDHCRKRKYIHRVDTWFGIALHPDGTLQLAVKLTGPRRFAHDMGAMPPTHAEHVGAGQKVGRNARCPCGSGKKYKRCCLGRWGTTPT